VPAYRAWELREQHATASAELAAVPPPTASQATACGYTAADLAETPDVSLGEEIRDLAASLTYSPTRIFRHVADRVEFQTYYGSLKGAMGTLVSGSGNATDQASLLIALLRASNIPSRYVKGIVAFPAADIRLLRWLGVKTPLAAAWHLWANRVPVGYTEDSPGVIRYVYFTHIWVEACVPYGNYRGTQGDRSGHRWIPLDPSFKDLAYQPGIPTNVTLDYTAYMAQRRNVLPHEQYATELEAVIKTMAPNFANNTLQDVGYVGAPRPRPMDILPASLPYEVWQFTAWDDATSPSAEVAALPERHRLKLEIVAERGVDAEHTSITDMILRWPVVTVAMSEIAVKRVTLSFKGVTAADQTRLDNWRNAPNPNLAAPCSPVTNVTPVIKVEGVEQAWTPPPSTPAMGVGPVNLCSGGNRLYMRITQLESAGIIVNGRVADDSPFTSPHGVMNHGTFRNLNAADYHALFAYAFQASDRLIRERSAKLLASVTSIANPNSDLEETEGELLHIAGLKFMRYTTDVIFQISRLDGSTGSSGMHIGLTLLCHRN
jgi:transglutaminase-like putative cysteine protease